MVEKVAQMLPAPSRRLSLGTPTSAPDTIPRLVYAGFAERRLNEMAAARRRGGLTSVYANNSSITHGFGSNLPGAPVNSNSRIPAGLARLLAREFITNGLDANSETSGSGSTSTNSPSAPVITASAVDPTHGAALTSGPTATVSLPNASYTGLTPPLTANRSKNTVPV